MFRDVAVRQAQLPPVALKATALPWKYGAARGGLQAIAGGSEAMTGHIHAYPMCSTGL